MFACKREATRRLKCRKANGLTQTDVAKKLGVTQSAYAHYENGVRKVEAEKIPLIAKILGVGVEELYGEAAKGEKAMPKLHKNTRTAKVQELFNKLPQNEQRVVLKQIELLSLETKRK